MRVCMREEGRKGGKPLGEVGHHHKLGLTGRALERTMLLYW
jgi:hypothetical protein